ncbi:DUF2306 domain-containing protein [Kistimonas asteriae]|uniref:DUF2306 domain-containing protein n=1 Tax=Kistimonas asteriae TaxID=517724 RepID=UPI001BAAA73A|nr:DUF2306 domain-containing protein [Kistimonas asteriae]
MNTPTAIHLAAALYALVVGGLQLALPKGTLPHRYLGRSWMAAMLITALSSFWIKSFMPLWLSFGPIHILSVWITICVIISTVAAWQHNIKQHKYYAVGAYVGIIGAGIGTLAPGRYLNQLFFGG